MRDTTKNDGETTGARRQTGGELIAAAAPWLLRQKIAIPGRVKGYVHRAGLLDRILPTNRGLTVLKASGGFGKTTLLAECCRRLRRDGVSTAWISLDEHDEPELLATYIALACLDAGLDLSDLQDAHGDGDRPLSQLGAVVRAVQALRKPFVIAFDELERLKSPASVSVLEFLLQGGPPNLHLVMACRQIPDGLNVAAWVLEGRAEIVATEEFRFTKTDVARFFGMSLSRRELAKEMDGSRGWPIAVRISRNRKQPQAAGRADVVEDFVRNWVESRLFGGLDNDLREALLDIGLLEWIDENLLDHVLQRTGAMRWLDSARVLDGLLEPVGGSGSDIRRLHPMVREHCARQRFRETPQRFRAIQRRIAEALMRRGETIPAMRHAIEAGERDLAGEILERAGGVRVWTRQGLVQLKAADRFLDEDVIATRPRLALVRCVVSVMSGDLDAARHRFRELTSDGPAENADKGDEDFEYSVDEWIVRGVFALYGGEPVGSELTRTLFKEYARLAKSPRLDKFLRGNMEYGLCVIHQLKAEFDAALRRFSGLQPLFVRSRYMMMHGNLLRGQIAMAQGQARSAESHYRSAKRVARRAFVLDPAHVVLVEVMLRELALECDRVSPAARLRRVPGAVMSTGTPFSAFAASCNLVIELWVRDGRIDKALSTADELLGYVRGVGLPSLIRYLAAVRVGLLTIAGHVADAEREWRMARLPEHTSGCVDLFQQGWREMEAISCARLRWLIETGRYDEGRRLACELISVSDARRLRRTQMRALALFTALESRAGKPGAAMAHLESFLRLFYEVSYAWPLVRERADCADVVRRFYDDNPRSPERPGAKSLLAAIRKAEEFRRPGLSERERDVLQRLAGQRDKQIASALGLTVHGVRYHLRKLFAKLGVSTRAEAVRRARELGLIPEQS